MPLIVTPWRLQQRAELYHQLGSMMSAGITLPQVLEHLIVSPPDRSFRRPLMELSTHLAQGSTFAEAMFRAKQWVPAFDIALLQAGETSGRLDACFKLLAQYYNEHAKMAREMISQMMYPFFLFHLAFLIFPPHLLPKLVWEGDVVGFVKQKVFFFVPFYVVVFILIYAGQGKHGENWRAKIEKILHLIPLIGSARRQLALARLSAALEALINAGVSIIEAWELAASASGSPALRKAILAWRPLVESGTTPGEALAGSREFPDMFTNLYRTGELSGKLDETLLRLRDYYTHEASRKLKMISEWLPKLLYIIILIVGGMMVIKFWTNYYGGAFNAM